VRCPAVIEVRIIPQDEMRYDTLGDWQWSGDTLHIRAAQGPGWQPFLVALHEMTEAVLCEQGGIPEAAVDAWDLSFRGEGEPGDDPACPYRTEHRAACIVEFLMASFLGLSGYGTMR